MLSEQLSRPETDDSRINELGASPFRLLRAGGKPGRQLRRHRFDVGRVVDTSHRICMLGWSPPIQPEAASARGCTKTD
jgi:hypothetical protein